MSPSEVDSLEIGELIAFLEVRQKQDIENQYRVWEVARWQTAWLLNVHTKKGKSIKVTDLIKLPCDDNIKKPKKKFTKATRDKFAKWDSIMAAKFNQEI